MTSCILQFSASEVPTGPDVGGPGPGVSLGHSTYDVAKGSIVTIHETVHSMVRRVYRVLRNLHYRLSPSSAPLGSFSYRFTSEGPVGRLPVSVLIRGDHPGCPDREQTAAWIEMQTLAEISAIAFDGTGREMWRCPAAGAGAIEEEPLWFTAPGGLPETSPTHLECCFTVAAAEDVDAVILIDSPTGPDCGTFGAAGAEGAMPWRQFALYRSDAYFWDPQNDRVVPRRAERLIKVIDIARGASSEHTTDTSNRRRRGPYLSSVDLGERLVVPVRDASRVVRRRPEAGLPAVLVTAPFLARGGAEQTLLATLQHLTDRFDFTIATLAPHREERGDRRGDFRTVTERILPLGDLVHPDVMVGVLQSILDATGAEVLYNANGTTLFYDFAPRLKQSHPKLRIIDHLYDHEVGYIERYDEGLKTAVDACVAENHVIARELVEGRGWAKARVPVIWPCGRPESDLPQPGDRELIRQSLREELELGADDFVILTAARMHPQKRPLDLVLLAERVRDLPATHFVVVGGGELEGEMDRAIAARPGLNLRRLPFRTDIPELIVASDVGCLVSDFEGLPVFMLECLQLGKPFLGTRVGDLGLVLDDTGAGIVVDHPGDLDELEAAIRRLSDRSFRSKLAERALSAAPKFSVDRCAAAYAAAFNGTA